MLFRVGSVATIDPKPIEPTTICPSRILSGLMTNIAAIISPVKNPVVIYMKNQQSPSRCLSAYPHTAHCVERLFQRSNILPFPHRGHRCASPCSRTVRMVEALAFALPVGAEMGPGPSGVLIAFSSRACRSSRVVWMARVPEGLEPVPFRFSSRRICRSRALLFPYPSLRAASPLPPPP